MAWQRNGPGGNGAESKDRVGGDSPKDTPPQQVDPNHLRDWIAEWIADDRAEGHRRLQGFTELRKRQRWVLLFSHPFAPLNATETLVLYALASFFNADGHPVYRSHQEICAASKLSRSAVKQAIASVESKGWVSREPGRPGRKTLYAVTPPLKDPRHMGHDTTHMGHEATHVGHDTTHMGHEATPHGSPDGHQSVGLGRSKSQEESARPPAAGRRRTPSPPSGEGNPNRCGACSALVKTDRTGVIQRCGCGNWPGFDLQRWS